VEDATTLSWSSAAVSECVSALSFTGAKSSCGTFVPWNIRSRGAKSARTFAPQERISQELSLNGNFVPWNFRSHTLKHWEKGKACKRHNTYPVGEVDLLRCVKLHKYTPENICTTR